MLALQSLHHFDHIGETIGLIARALRPGGLLIVDEFVGPSRADGRIKRRVIRPSVLSMRLDDPSEAAEASDLLPALRQNFTILEEHPYGIALHLALHGIAHNFLGDDPVTAQVLRQCFTAEEEASARLPHDYIYAVYRPAASQANALRRD